MDRLKKILKSKTFIIVLLVIGFMYFNNTSLFSEPTNEKPLLLAHRGLGQTFHMENLENDTCTAERIFKPEHPYLENTFASMEAAFKHGADIVELDVHMTKDNQFAIFHDWTLDCRTNAKGTTKDYTMEELKKLDIGYGYTADNGKTYPFRGKGIGLMPSLMEVLHRYPDKTFLIDVKSDDPKEGELLAFYLSKLPKKQQSQLAVYGGDNPIAALKEKMPDMRVMSRATIKSCLLPYVGIGWTGYMPSACEGTQLHIPEKLAPLLWGWPYKFMDRMKQVDTRVIVVGGNGMDWSSGLDTIEDVKQLPENFSGGIWTNRIDRIGPFYKK